MNNETMSPATTVKLVSDAAQNLTGGRILQSTSGSVNTTSTINVPDGAMGFRIFPTSNSIRFGINEAPAAVGSLPTLANGGIAKNDIWETRIIGNGVSRTLQLLSTAATTVDVEFF